MRRFAGPTRCNKTIHEGGWGIAGGPGNTNPDCKKIVIKMKEIQLEGGGMEGRILLGNMAKESATWILIKKKPQKKGWVGHWEKRA